MRIGLDARVLQSGPITGVQEYTRFLYKSLLRIESTHEWVLYFNTSHGVDEKIYQNLGANNVVTRTTPSKLIGLMSVFGIGQTIDGFCEKKGYKLDAFFSPNINFTRVSSSVPFFLTIHDLSFIHYPEYFNGWRRIWHRLVRPAELARQAQVILPPSHSTARDLKATFRVDEEKIRTLSPAVDPNFGDFINQDLSVREKMVKEVKKKFHLPEKYFIFVGAIEPRKNLLGILEAYSLVRKENPHCPGLIIVGPHGWKCEDILRQMTLTQGVKYIGYVAAEDRPALYAGAVALVYPSYYEGFGFPIIEAGVVGTPVVASARAALVEFDWEGIVYVNPRNVCDIARGMVEVGNIQPTPLPNVRQWDDVAREFISILEKKYENRH